MIPLSLQGDAARAARGAMIAVAQADGVIDAQELALIECLAGLDGAPLDAVGAARPDEVAATITEPSARRALVQRLVMVALMDQTADDAEIAQVGAFARALDVDEPGVAQLRLLARGHHRRLGFDLMRRGFLRERLAAEWKAKGFRGLWALLRAGAGDPALAARYGALADAPPGSLGRALHAYFRDNEFSLPGEKGAAPEMLIFHDLGHVLTGAATDPAGEVEMVGFEAGYMRETGFSVVVLAMVLFHFGVKLPGMAATPAEGAFDPALFDRAYRRGSKVTVDLRGWDFWPYADQPLDAVRERLGVEPT